MIYGKEFVNDKTDIKYKFHERTIIHKEII